MPAVPLFIMTSGYLYLAKGYSTTKIVKKAGHFFALSIIWGVFLGVYETIKIPIWPWQDDFFVSIINQLVYNTGHLWYLYMFSGVILVCPLLIAALKQPNGIRILQYSAIVLLIFPILRSSLALIPVSGNNYLSGVMNNIALFDGWSGYIGYFILGYLLAYDQISQSWLSKRRFWLYVIGLLMVLLGAVASMFASYKTGVATWAYYEKFTFPCFLWTISLFLFFRLTVSRVQLSQRTQYVIRMLSQLTFGVYLVHWAFTRYMDGHEVHFIETYPILSVPVAACVIALISFSIIAILSKVPGIKKLVG